MNIVEQINKASEAWGITCFRYEIRKYPETACTKFMFVSMDIISSLFVPGNIQLPARVQEAMQMQVEAERKKRAAVLESEGKREAEINIAEGKRRAKILQSGKHRNE